MITFLKNHVNEHNIDAFTDVQDPFVCLLEPEMQPADAWVQRVEKYIIRHPEHDVYHVDLKGEPGFPRKVSAGKLFKLVFVQGRLAPLSSFVFRWSMFKDKAVFRADGSLDPMATIMACAQLRPIRTVWLLKTDGPAPVAPADDARVWERIELYRWTEAFFGEDDYPIGTGDRMDLYAATLAKLYPGRTEEELKEVMGNFQVAQGPIRRRRAASALKKALQERKKDLQ